MANKNIFGSATPGKTVPVADAVNEAGGKAYAYTPEHALAQYCMTGTFNDTFYSTAEEQVKAVLALLDKVSVKYVAQLAVFSREKGYMKDMPALLCAYLTNSTEGLEYLREVFPRVIDNGKMLRNFVQMIRSGVVGRKSLGTAPQRLVQEWFNSRSDYDVFRNSVGNDPSMVDVIKLARPKPQTEERRALINYLMGRDYDAKLLPGPVQHLIQLSKGEHNGELPKVPIEMLMGLELTTDEWVTMAKQASWTQVRMNLNTFLRHDVFKNKTATEHVAGLLKDPEQVRKAKVFPYQLMAAFMNSDSGVPQSVTNALQDAMEIAIENVPFLDARVVICTDVSGSMSSSVTGRRVGATSKVKCIDVAGLVSAVFMKRAEKNLVLPFNGKVVDMSKSKMNPRDSIMTNAKKLADLGGGSTNCAAPLALLNQDKVDVDLVIFVSDNQSWFHNQPASYYGGSGTSVQTEWNKLKARCPKAKMVCIDIEANGTTQAKEDKDVLNIGGFSDQVFTTIRDFLNGTISPDHWVGVIKATELKQN